MKNITKIKTKYKQLENLSVAEKEKYSEILLSLLLEYYDGEQDIAISEVSGDGFMITFGLDAHVCPIDYIIKVITKHHKFTDEDLDKGSI
jgi:hypothetical protein